MGPVLSPPGIIFTSFTMFYKSSEVAALLCCRRLHFLVTRSNHKNSTSHIVMPIPLPRPVNRPSEPDPESMLLCRNPAPRSFDAPDSLAAPAPLTVQPPKPRPVPAPIPRGPVPSPLGMIVSSLYFGRLFFYSLVIAAPHLGHFRSMQGTPRLCGSLCPHCGHTQAPAGPAARGPPIRPGFRPP
jgi:hypothetical protein